MKCNHLIGTFGKYIDKNKQITLLKQKINKLQHKLPKQKQLSLLDDLTGLFNRRKLLKDINRYSSIQKRFKIPFYICMIDLDGFKELNDRKGHLIGDKLLQKTAKLLCNNIRNYENVYRGYEGDEFFIIFSHSNNPKFLKDKVITTLKRYKIKASIGIVKLGRNCLKRVDKAMYKDKRSR